jgi:hypothetical protein
MTLFLSWTFHIWKTDLCLNTCKKSYSVIWNTQVISCIPCCHQKRDNVNNFSKCFVYIDMHNFSYFAFRI